MHKPIDKSILQPILSGDSKAIARGISLIENEVDGYRELLSTLTPKEVPVVGITGPPGAGKSTIVDGLIEELANNNKRVAVLCIDPSSPFHQGALLGDRIRMSRWYLHPLVFIRSFATRGSLGGLNARIIEITELLKSSIFDYIIVETVGVGQSEIEISGLADLTVVVLVPEAGDEIQVMKSGLMEIADCFVVNKSDRPEASLFTKNLGSILIHQQHISVINTVATKGEGLPQLAQKLKDISTGTNRKKTWLYAAKALQLIQEDRMKDIDQEAFKEAIADALQTPGFNLFRFVEKYRR